MWSQIKERCSYLHWCLYYNGLVLSWWGGGGLQLCHTVAILAQVLARAAVCAFRRGGVNGCGCVCLAEDYGVSSVQTQTPHQASGSAGGAALHLGEPRASGLVRSGA